MIRRNITATLLKAAEGYPVITLTGPRQSGKTTLVKAVFSSHQYVSLEDPDQRNFALEDPRGFLSQFRHKAIIDEAQRAPDIFSYIQTLVDENDTPGRFILTGSQNFLLLESISQSLAGRTAVLNLLPLSFMELQNFPDFNINDIISSSSDGELFSEPDLMNTLFSGFYPRIHQKSLNPQGWLQNYYQTYIERDVRSILNIGDLEAFGRFIRLCAGRNGQILNLSSIATDCGVTHSTTRRWLSVLQASFIIFLLNPHHRNYRKRLIRRPKLYFLDSGFLCYLLRISSPDDIRMHPNRGAIFESFITSEFIKNALNDGRNPDLYFWRDSTGHEVDLILEQGSITIPIELKSGQTFNSDYLKGLKYLKNLSKTPDDPALLIYGGSKAYIRSGITVKPWYYF